jgi:FkbM family methyltransferase
VHRPQFEESGGVNSSRKLAKQFLGLFGLDVRLLRNVRAHEVRTWEQTQDALWRPFLAHHDVRTVIDVGANTGQFARLIHRVCPAAKVFSFEPLANCRAELDDTLARIPGSKTFPIALGDTTGTVPMRQSAFSPCSSLLNGTNHLGDDYPEAAITSTIDVPLERLDDALKGETLEPGILVKLDVQGYEIPVIRGALQTLGRASLVVVEVCFFRKLYEGQPLFDDVYRTLRDLGFNYMGSPEQYPQKRDGRIVEADAVFERSAD